LEHVNRKVFAQPDRAEVQERVIRAVEACPEAFIEAYKDSPDTYGGRYIAADAFKDTFEPFRQSP
jgi:hypothetical protein